MRRFAFLAISLALFLGVVNPTHATPRGQEVSEPVAPNERSAGASGDDDLPSKTALQAAADTQLPSRAVEYGQVPQRGSRIVHLVTQFMTRIGTYVDHVGRLIAQTRR